jgi:hypothetical protein
MRNGLMAIVAVIGLSFQPSGTPASAQTPAIKGTPAPALKINGMDYGRARKMILAQGWKAVPGPCQQIDQKTCGYFPEIESCAGAGASYCAMAFVRQNQCLYVTTLGDPPYGSDAGAARVKKTTFRPGPCEKY